MNAMTIDPPYDEEEGDEEEDDDEELPPLDAWAAVPDVLLDVDPLDDGDYLTALFEVRRRLERGREGAD